MKKIKKAAQTRIKSLSPQHAWGVGEKGEGEEHILI